MAARKRPAPANGALYRAITARTIEISVGGTVVVLKAPSRATAELVREAQLTLVPEERGEDRDLKRTAEYGLKIASLCTQVTWPEEITEEEARHLVLVTGGEQGAIVAAAFELCGIRFGREAEDALDRPT